MRRDELHDGLGRRVHAVRELVHEPGERALVTLVAERGERHLGELGRDVVIVSGATAYRHLFGAYDMAPTPISKANSGLQIGFVLVVVVLLAGFPIPYWLVPVLLWLVVASTLASGAHYVWLWSHKAMSQANKPS